jgi:hypothetical protein
VFPGAEGFGTDTVAGRGGQIIVVSTLAESGPGSLREALSASGPRVVLFEVGGVIALSSAVVISNPYVTVAGQSAPDPGITLTGAGLVVTTHDVLVQHIRSRPGDDPAGPDPEGRDGIGVVGRPDGSGETFNVVIDHCSVSWAIDEGVSTWYAGVHDVTFSNNIIAENLAHSLHPKGEHSKGLLIGDHSRRISVIGNLFAHNTRRNPLLKGDTSTLVANNIIYNPGSQAIGFSDPEWSGPSRASIIGNLVIPGASTTSSARAIWRGIETSGDIQVYADDTSIRDSTTDPWVPDSRMSRVLVAEPPVSVAPLSLSAAADLEATLLTSAGARPAARDAVDIRIVASVENRSGRIIDSPAEVGGYPTPTPGSHTLAIPPDPHGDDDGDGYTNLEEWLHTLAAGVEGR